jgi:hypothetical protein
VLLDETMTMVDGMVVVMCYSLNVVGFLAREVPRIFCLVCVCNLMFGILACKK